jgi:ribosomal protein L11 methyltransferase
LIRLAVRCRPEQAEQVLAELVAAYPDGVEEAEGPGYVEYALYGAPGELPELPALEAMAGDGLVEVETEEVPDDWADRWRDFHRPRTVAGTVYLRPPWEAPTQDALIDVVIDPGQAFGTGSHPTTAMCLELLCEAAAHGVGGSLADWGTGSGVLAVAAAKLGWSPVLACDNDRAAIEHARANAEANRVGIDLARCDVRAEAPPAATTVTANLTRPLLAAALAWPIDETQRVICSGLLVSELDEIAELAGNRGLSERRRLTEGDWGALSLVRS